MAMKRSRYTFGSLGRQNHGWLHPWHPAHPSGDIVSRLWKIGDHCCLPIVVINRNLIPGPCIRKCNRDVSWWPGCSNDIILNSHNDRVPLSSWSIVKNHIQYFHIRRRLRTRISTCWALMFTRRLCDPKINQICGQC